MRDLNMTMREALRTDQAVAQALKAWAVEANPMCAVRRVSEGYIMQERFAHVARASSPAGFGSIPAPVRAHRPKD